MKNIQDGYENTMSLLLNEILEKLKTYDEVDILELLQIDTEMLLDRFSDLLEEKADEVEEKLDEG